MHKNPVVDGKKLCSKCQMLIPIDGYYARQDVPNAIRSYCKSCHKVYSAVSASKRRKSNRSYFLSCDGKHFSYHIKRKYGISIDKYNELLESQNNTCAICGRQERAINTEGNNKRLAVDHNHKTGKVRGLLCSSCNQMIGLAQEDVAILQSAIAYIERYNASN